MSMNNTCIDYFNYYLKEFLNDLISIYPKYKEPILRNYRTFLENKENKSDKYLKYFISKINDYLPQIAKRDESIFNNSNLIFIEGVRLNELWDDSNLTETNKKTIWKYLQLLSLLGRRTLINQDELKDMLEKIGTSMKVLDKVDNILTNEEDNSKQNDNSGGIFSGMMDGITGDSDGEVNIMGELMKGFGLGKIFEDFDFNEFTKNMEGAFNTQEEPNFNDTCGDVSTNSDEEVNNVNVSDSGNIEVEKISDNDNEDKCVNNTTTNDNTKQKHTNVFEELTGDIAKTFNIDPNDNSENPEQALEKVKELFSGDGQKKLFGLMGKFTKKMQNQGNQQEMMEQYAAMMQQTGVGANATKMAEELAQSGHLTNAQKNRVMSGNRNQTARDRLRAKLDKRNNAKNN